MTQNPNDYYDCTTIVMGKYVENCDGQHEYALEEATAKHFVEAFALWYELDFFDEKKNWLAIRISYPTNHFFKEELLAAIKFFMQFHDYSIINTFSCRKPID